MMHGQTQIKYGVEFILRARWGQLRVDTQRKKIKIQRRRKDE
jgi:hypothetical protein